jgi:small conductance mechanosensitive channel
LILNIWSVDVTPALWSAGIVTAALAFGAQWIVKDVIAGLSVLFEDQFDVGDSVELLTSTNAVVIGTVESIGLRSTRLADSRGRLISLSNGNIQMVTNASRLPTRISFALELPWRADASAMRKRVEDKGIFRIEVSASRSGEQIAERGFVERLVSRLQDDGWLPAGAAAAASDHEETH